MERNMKEGSDLSLDEYMEKRLEEWSVGPSEKEPCTIYRVPSHLSKEDESAYQPKIISIGPYHHCDNGLKAMEEHKWQFLSEFLKRDNSKVPLKRYLDKVREKEKKARSHYSEKLVQLSSDDFVQMMVLDGCFIIELFLKRYQAKDVMIYSTRWILPLITNDMLLLENQLPFLILQELFQLADLGIHDGENLITIKTLAIHFFSHLLVGDDKSLPGEQEPFHLLHLLHLFHTRRLKDSTDSSQATDSNKMQHNSSQTPPQQPLTTSSHSDIESQAPETESKKTGRFGNRKWEGVVFLLQTKIGFPRKPSSPQKSIPCATELHEAGVKFKVKKDTNSYLEVTFGDGVMEIPYLLIKDNTNSLFRNFIAFEQCRLDSKCHFTSYAFFMDCIVNTPADVALLGQNKILEHWLDSDEAVARLFNGLCRGVAMDTQIRLYFPKLFQDVKDYCNTTWHTWRARLMRDYFKLMNDYFTNPWLIISIVAATIVLLLTFVQTFFTVIAYVQHRT